MNDYFKVLSEFIKKKERQKKKKREAHSVLTGSNHGSIYSGSEIRQFMQNKVWNFAHYVVLRLYTEVNAKRKKEKKRTQTKN